jgi:hypothetical protein
MIEILVHPKGVTSEMTQQIYKNQTYHDPTDLVNGFRLAQTSDKIRLGLFYQNEDRPVYEEVRAVPTHTADEKIAILNAELDKYAV